ncbi:MAG TPA: hypothetical protein VFN52_04465 [Acidiferrobacteraceae bacterium]|nr:hypothetical protein [Acidiferrobacteraceae bacterium]
MRQQVNLYHPIFRKEAKRFSAVAMAQAGFAVVLGVLLLYGYALWQIHGTRMAVVASRGQVRAAAQELAHVQQQFGGGAYAARLQAFRRQIREQRVLAEALSHGGLGNVQGYSRYLFALGQAARPGLWITSFSVTGDGVRLTLMGRTVDPAIVPDYLAALSRQPAFAHITFGHFRVVRPHPWHGYLEFEVARHPKVARHLKVSS